MASAWGRWGDDLLWGDDGNDLVNGGSGVDQVFGGAGNDTLISNSGLTTLTGGAGSDTFVVQNAGASKNIFTTITDFSVGDSIKLADKGNETFSSTKVALATGVAETLANYANAAAAGDGSTNGIIKWFQFDGNTYVVQDVSFSSSFVDGADILVKLTGLIDLSNSALSINSSTPSLTLFA